jgi:hypothetical protein
MDANGGLSDVSLAEASGGGIALLAAALSLADPEKRRQQQAAEIEGMIRRWLKTISTLLGSRDGSVFTGSKMT